MNLGVRGFTLIEMLVVVGIVGVLAGIGVSNYRTFAARARTQEAKVALSSIYMAELNFFATQYSYSLCLFQMGFRPTLPNSYYLGFMNGGVANDCGPSATLPCNIFDYGNPGATVCNYSAAPVSDAYGIHNDAGWGIINDPDPSTPLNTSYIWKVTKSTFTAGAQGKIVAGRLDVWTINQTKTLVRVQVGE